jgi:hypothetical protein
MLEAAGGANVFADVKRQSIQTTSELAVARAPEVIVEIGVDTASAAGRNLDAWTVLGPRISQSVRRVAEVLHPTAFAGSDPRTVPAAVDRGRGSMSGTGTGTGVRPR